MLRLQSGFILFDESSQFVLDGAYRDSEQRNKKDRGYAVRQKLPEIGNELIFKKKKVSCFSLLVTFTETRSDVDGQWFSHESEEQKQPP